MFSMSRSTEKFHSWKCPTTVWRVIPLEMHFFVAFGYSNNQREATLITKCEVAKAKFWESLTFMFFYSNVDNLH